MDGCDLFCSFLLSANGRALRTSLCMVTGRMKEPTRLLCFHPAHSEVLDTTDVVGSGTANGNDTLDVPIITMIYDLITEHSDVL